MAEIGELRTRFGREYIYLNPEPNGPGTVGTWRLRIDDSGTPIDPDNPDQGGGSATRGTGTAAIDLVVGQLVYVQANGLINLASAANEATANAVGMVEESKTAGEEVFFISNTIADLFNVGTLVDGSPAGLIPGVTYYLSTTPGNWTTTPDTTTVGAVVRSCGVAIDPSKMSVEIQTGTVL